MPEAEVPPMEEPTPATESSNPNLFISQDQFPENVAESMKPGDAITFVGRDADGNLEFEYEPPGEMDWRDDMRKNVSAI